MGLSKILKSYDLSNLTIGVLGSHSALDISRGAKEEGFKSLVVAKKGREKTYQKYYQTSKEPNYTDAVKLIGCVDECLVINNFTDLLSKNIQKQLLERNVIFIPHRSFEVYLNFDYEAIERDFEVPMFGNRHLLKIEERGKAKNQYYLLDKAKIRYPKQFKNYKEIDRLCLVKVLEKERGFERAFFLTDSPQDYENQVEERLKKGLFSKEQLKESVIEEFVLGVQVNFNFFYSPISGRLELLGTDTRRQTNIEGLLKVPGMYQEDVRKKINVKYEEAGHIAATVLESLLEDAFELGKKFVEVCKKEANPGIIGPFALQSIVIAGPPKKEIVVIDISPRVPGSPGITATPYSYYFFGKPVGVGQRIAMELKQAVKEDKLKKVLT